jgi:hypothetical protein
MTLLGIDPGKETATNIPNSADQQTERQGLLIAVKVQFLPFELVITPLLVTATNIPNSADQQTERF